LFAGFCFEAGDARNSEQPVLTAVHTVFMRLHNEMVEELSRLNPQWSDETLYQEGRRIASAVQQHVTWNEFLPRVLGWNAINLYELNLDSEGYYNGYDEKCNPTILNEFATSAFRFGHSLLKPTFKRMDN
jgi:peroxidase